MALSAAAKGVPVQLVPVGINPDRKTDFRSRMTVVYGQPFSVRLGSTVADLTDAIARHMRQLIVEADPEADAALVRRVERLYTSERRAERDHAFARSSAGGVIAAGVHRLRETDPAWYESALLQLRRYDERLRRFGLRDRALDWNTSRADAVRFVARAAPALVLVPVGIAGDRRIFAVPYLLTAAVGRRHEQTRRHRDSEGCRGHDLLFAWIAVLALLTWSRAGALAGNRRSSPAAGAGGRRTLRHRARAVGVAHGAFVARASRHASQHAPAPAPSPRRAG